MMSSTKPKTFHYYVFCALFAFLFTACERDSFNETNDERVAPIIVLPTESEVREAYEGQTVNATVSFEAQAGIASIQVNRDGQPLETIQGVSGQVGRNYAIQYLVPEGATVGSSVVYNFVLEDRQGRHVEQNFTIRIIDAPPIPDFEFEDIVVGGNSYKLINLDINTDVTLTKDNDYLLRGKIAIESGYTVTIEEGTTIYAESNAALTVSTGAKLIAEGTSTEPIKFTSFADRTGGGAAGQWLGIFIHGLATVEGGANTTVTGENGVNRGYGGTNDADDSGTLKYVEISYAGAPINTAGNTAAALVNGALNLNGVGNGTEIDHIYINASGNSFSGISIAGGTVSMKYLFVHNSAGRALLWKAGYSGMIQFFVANYSANPGNAFTAIDPYGPYGGATVPIVSNVSIQGGGQGNTRGVRFRNETSGAYIGESKGSMYNCWITGTGNPGLRTDATNGVIFSNSRVWGNGSGSQNFHTTASGYNSSASPHFNSTDPVAITEGYKGIATGGIDPAALNPWFTSVTYIGAVDPANDWTTGWINIP